MTFIRRLSFCALFLAAAASATAAKFPADYDFDGDGSADISVFHRAAGDWYIQESSNSSVRIQNWGWSEVVPVPGDYDGDGITDIAVYHKAAGDWYIQQSSDGAFRFQNWGWAGAYPVPADYDGDGKCDLAVYDRSKGDWYIQQSSDSSFIFQNWGWFGARPVPADYDGDGTDDVAVYDPLGFAWYVNRSQDGFLKVDFGVTGGIPARGYYDSDQLADYMLYVPESGNWHFVLTTGGSGVANWGWSEALPTAADYDGDGTTDIAVYYPTTGTHYILQTSSGTARIQNWGWIDSRAVQSYADGALEDLKVHAHGDSITFGQGSSSQGPSTGYPILFERKIESTHGGNWTTFNYGNPGETTSTGLQRLALNLDTTHPDILFLMEGTNDTFFNAPNSQIENNLRAMISIAQARGIFVVLATIPPVIANQFRDRSAQQQRIISFNPRIYSIGASMGVPVAPVFEYITAVPGWETLLIEQETANHPNDAGYLLVRDAFFDALTPWLNAGSVY